MPLSGFGNIDTQRSDVGALHKSLVNRSALQPRGELVGTESSDTRGFQVIDDAAQSGAWVPNHDQIDLLFLGKSNDRGVVGNIKQRTLGLLRNASIAGRAVELVRERTCRDLPG